jgi:hypothetical protein
MSRSPSEETEWRGSDFGGGKVRLVTAMKKIKKSRIASAATPGKRKPRLTDRLKKLIGR